MPCNACSLDWTHEPVPANGYCEWDGHLNWSVCTYPNPPRTDGEFHGERCAGKCACNHLFCTHHAKYHAEVAHRSSMPACFPESGKSVSGPAIEAAASDAILQSLAEDRLLDDVAAVDRFLQVVTPGAPALADATRYHDGSAIYGPDHSVHLLAVFLDSRRLSQVIALALRALGVSWHWSGDTAPARRSSLSGWLKRRHGLNPERLDQLAEWAINGTAPATRQEPLQAWLIPFLGTGLGDRVYGVAHTVEELLSPFNSDLRSLPSADEDVARWLANRADTDDQSASAPLPPMAAHVDAMSKRATAPMRTLNA
jgi:hypothetical protein